MIKIPKAVLVIAGMLLFFLGIGLGVDGGRKVMALETPFNEIALRAKHTDQCKKAAEDSGYKIEHQGARVTAYLDGLDDYRASIFQAGWLAQGCEGFIVEEFCIGLSCANENVRANVIMTLTYSNKSLRLY